jgi:PAS domain S-box-containing protein
MDGEDKRKGRRSNEPLRPDCQAAGPTTEEAPAEPADGTFCVTGSLYRKLFSLAPGLMAITDFATGRLIDVNEAFVSWSQCPRDGLVGRTTAELGFWHNTRRREEVMEALCATGLVHDLEIELRRGNGEVVPMLFSARIIEEGKRRFMLSFAHDITKQKQADKALKEKEEKYRNLVEATTDWVWEMDAEGRFIYSNRNISDLLGYQPEEIMGRTPFDFALPEYAQRSWAVFHDKKPFQHLQDILIHRDGTLVTLDTSGVPIFNDQGAFVKYRGVTRDVTDLKRAGHALRESEERYRRIVDTAQEGVWALDENLATTFVNSHMAAMLGLTPEEMIGRPVEAVMFPEDVDDFRERMKRRQCGLSEQYERRYPVKGGGEVWTIVSATSAMDEEGHFRGSFGMFTDITERKRMEEELRRHQDQLEELVLQRTAEVERKTEDLKDANAALRALLKVKEEDVRELETKVLSNVRELILPSLGRLKRAIGGPHKELIGTLEANLNNIVSPFVQSVAALGLTPTEVKIADLVRDGKTAKEMAGLLHLSPRSVEAHRYRIRKKLKLGNSINLRSYLLSIS